MRKYTVAYRVATYEGERTVWADADEEAIGKVRSWARQQTSLPMYSESYRVVSVAGDKDEDDE